MMHKYLIIISLLFATQQSIFAQEQSLSSTANNETIDSIASAPCNYYIELESFQAAGQNSQSSVKLNICRVLKSHLQLTDEEYKRVTEKRFPSLIDAANALGINGWTLVSTETTEQRSGRTSRWIMTKSTPNPKDLLKGLL